jgi:molecular chaperone IbpA
MADYNHFLEPWGHDNMYPTRKPKPKAEPVNIASLFPNLDSWALGFDEMFRELEKQAVSKNASFPPYNLVRDGDNYEINMALAGYKKENIKVSINGRSLVIETVDLPEDDGERELIHKGIAQRSFKSTFALGEHIELKEAKLVDGLLVISLALELPEEKKPRVIDIQ